MIAIILAAGYATRLYPLTKNKAKPLLEVGGKPAVEHTRKKIEPFADRIVIVTNNKFYRDFLKYAEGKNIEVLNDLTTSNENRLGGIGDLHYAIEKLNLDDDLFVIAGDNLFEFSVKDFINFFKQKQSAVIALKDIIDFEEARLFGTASINEKNKIISFGEKLKHATSGLIATACYIFPKEYTGYIKNYMNTDNNKDGPGFLIKHFYPKKAIYGFVFSEDWFDIGSLEGYERAKKKYNKS